MNTLIDKDLNTMRTLSQMANMIHTYYNELLNAGFDEQKAFALASQYQYMMLRYIHNSKD